MNDRSLFVELRRQELVMQIEALHSHLFSLQPPLKPIASLFLLTLLFLLLAHFLF